MHHEGDEGHVFHQILTLIQDFDGNLVALAFTTKDVLRRNLEIVEIEGASRGSPDTEFLLLLRNLNAHIFCGHETGDAFVTLASVHLE